MKFGRRWRRALLALVALILAAGAAAPFLRADRWAPRIRASLERSLHRKVELGRVRMNLFTGPGFSVDNVVIHEDPAAGLEPVAYVSQMDARIRLWSLIQGRLEFSNLRLFEPSLNLARVPDGPWNLQGLLGSAGAGAPAPTAGRVPRIQVRSGRVNFKIGDLKSVFYLSNADVDVFPAEGGAVVRFTGEPARTDRGAQGFGRLSGRVEWRAGPGGGEVSADLELKRSAIGEIVRLVHGHDVGLHGLVASRARLTGTLSDLQIAGRLQIEDIHRWDLMPPKGEGWLIDYRGRFNLLDQVLEVATVPQKGKLAPIEARFRAANLFTVPRWGSAVTLRLPLAPLLDVARHFGARLPGEMRLEGSLEGVVGFSRTAGWQGQLGVSQALIEFPSGVSLNVAKAAVLVDGSRLFLRPAEVRLPRERTAQMEAEYDLQAQRLLVTLAARALPTRTLRDLELLLAAPPVPFLETCKEGQWKGWLRFVREGETAGRWSAGGEIRDARLAVPGLAAPVELASASVQLDGDRLALTRIRAAAGECEFSGQYRYEPKTPHPHQFRLSADEVSLASLEPLLLPTLRRQQGFLARTLQWRRSAIPDWLRSRRLEGTLALNAVDAAGNRLERVRARLVWDGTRVDIPELTSRWNDGTVTAKGRVTLAASSPRYEFDAALHGVAWHGGTLDATLRLKTEGIGADLLANLESTGSLAGRSLDVLSGADCRKLSAHYELAGRRGAPLLSFSKVEMTLGDEVYQGKGRVQPDGRLEFQLTSGEKELRLFGTVSPFSMEAVPPSQQP